MIKKEYKEFWMFKADKRLKEKLDEIRIKRLVNAKDKQITSYKRLSLAMARHEKLLADLANADFVEERR